MRKDLCTNTVGSFTDPQLLKESTTVAKIFRALNLGDDERPTKRRKTLPNSPEDVNESAYQNIVMLLNGSTQDSPVLSLANLHNIVQ
jgi:serine/threonine-protein kinase ATR